jgi:hypothetical protein
MVIHLKLGVGDLAGDLSYGLIVAACPIPVEESFVAVRVGWCVKWSVNTVAEWLRSAGAVNPAPPNNSFNRSAI